MAGANGALTLGTYRDLWAGPITELNPPLKFLKPSQRLEVSPEDAERLIMRARVAVGWIEAPPEEEAEDELEAEPEPYDEAAAVFGEANRS